VKRGSLLRTTLGILLGLTVTLLGATFTVVDAMAMGGTTAFALFGLVVTVGGLAIIVKSARRQGAARK
jgi:hypothetical protein